MPGKDNAKIDVQPYRPLEWGPTYEFYINVTGDNTRGQATLGYEGSSVSGRAPNYQQYIDVTLSGDCSDPEFDGR